MAKSTDGANCSLASNSAGLNVYIVCTLCVIHFVHGHIGHCALLYSLHYRRRSSRLRPGEPNKAIRRLSKPSKGPGSIRLNESLDWSLNVRLEGLLDRSLEGPLGEPFS